MLLTQNKGCATKALQALVPEWFIQTSERLDLDSGVGHENVAAQRQGVFKPVHQLSTGPSAEGNSVYPKDRVCPEASSKETPHNHIQLMKPQKRRQFKELPYPLRFHDSFSLSLLLKFTLSFA